MRRIRCLQILRDDVVRQPERGAGVDRVRLKVAAVVAVPGTASPSPTKGDGSRPGIVCPSIEAGAIVDARRIDIQTQPAEAIAAVIAVVFMAMVVVGPPRKVVDRKSTRLNSSH